jgi:hypothetical protein
MKFPALWFPEEDINKYRQKFEVTKNDPGIELYFYLKKIIIKY